MDRANYSRAELIERVDFSSDHMMAKFKMGDPSTFLPGQYATIGIEEGGRLIQRPYSIVSSPREPVLEFYVELVPGGALTPRLWELKVGDVVLIRKRMAGKLTLCEDLGDLHHVMLATVTGAAPFISILRTHAIDLKTGRAPSRRFALFHGTSRSADLGIYKDELTMLARDGWLDYVPTVSRPWEDTAVASSHSTRHRKSPAKHRRGPRSCRRNDRDSHRRLSRHHRNLPIDGQRGRLRDELRRDPVRRFP